MTSAARAAPVVRKRKRTVPTILVRDAYLDNQPLIVKLLVNGSLDPSFGAFMDLARTDVIQGTLDMLILQTLSLAPLHGYGITKRIEQVSRGVFVVNPGSLLTALRRLQRSGWLDSEWKQTENARRAKFYSLTPVGERHLAAEKDDWSRRVGAVGRLLGAEG
jgi:transcriptional regulator